MTEAENTLHSYSAGLAETHPGVLGAGLRHRQNWSVGAVRYDQ